MSNGGASDGMEVDDPNLIRVRVGNVNALGLGGVTVEKRIDGFPWRVKVYRRDEKNIGVIINCDKSRESALWECEVEGEVKLINQLDDSRSVFKIIGSKLFTFETVCDMIYVESFLDAIGDSNIVVDGAFIIEAKIVVVGGANGDRFRKRPQTDFFSSSNYSDVIISVEGKKLYVSKQILANASYYFEILFYGDFKKSTDNEIIITDVSLHDFLRMLELIYDTKKKLEGYGMESILKAADQYQIQKVVFAAEERLIEMSQSRYNSTEMLLLADKYSLFNLQAFCLHHWYEFRPDDEHQVIISDSYKDFSNEFKNEINKWSSHSGEDNYEEIQKMQNILKKKHVDRIEKMMPKPDLLSPSRFSDVVLVVGEEKIYASKQILAHASFYFENLFYGDPAKINEKEFIIAEVSSTEFRVALEMIYNSRLKVDVDNVHFLLKMADRFKITSLTDKAEEFLLSNTSLRLHKKLCLAEQFTLEVLMRRCLKNIRNCRQITTMTKSDSYKHYSSELKIQLFEKMSKLWDEENPEEEDVEEMED